MKSTRGVHARWSAYSPPSQAGSHGFLSPLLTHFRRLARDVQHEIWPTPEQAVLRELEWRAVHEPRRVAGQIAVPPYRFEYVDAMSTWPQWDDIFVHQSLGFHSDVAEPRILDCGANIGLASIYFKRRYPHAKLTAFEADPRLAALCRSNLDFNDDTGDVEVHAAAVWTADGMLEFVCEGTDSGAIASLGEPIQGPVTTVRSVRLRDWLDEPVDLLKLDVEGAELQILADCRDRLSNVRSMFVELHESNPGRRQSGTLFDLLTAAGFLFDVRTLTPLPWRSPQVRSPFKDASLSWVATIRAWRP
jgi:FkbM family methyltransferase